MRSAWPSGTRETPADTIRVTFGVRLVNPDSIASPFFTALGETERRVLMDAKGLMDPDSLRHVLRKYLALRAFRSHGRIEAIERQYERSEGTAHYIGCRAAARATESDASRAAGCIRKELTTPLEEFPSFPSEDALETAMQGERQPYVDSVGVMCLHWGGLIAHPSSP